MKKILMVVLAVAGISNAAPLFTATSSNPYEVTITLTDTVPTLECPMYISYAPLLAFGINPNDATLTGVGASIVALSVDTDYVVYSLGLAGTANLPQGVLAILDINGAAPNVGATPVALDVYNSDAEVIGQVSVMVPEPITMSLLAIGGLFLRRKK